MGLLRSVNLSADKSNEAWARVFRLAAKRRLFPADPHLGVKKLLLRFENGVFHVGQIGLLQNLVDSLVARKEQRFLGGFIRDFQIARPRNAAEARRIADLTFTML
jgi:hypothetical protein